ncbi:MarR family winged helix-turn-helix transcriptional regulator [Actinocorallia longicatena]|uniref:HTH marR-type domain-containing protein n=1 Tax=Actinocorallia longicatena TaxID=111803 RepID=A0ABP6PZ41_9ACTN
MEPAQLADLLMRAARRIRHGQSDALAPLGLNPSQARALRVVLRAEAPLRMSDLAARLGIVPRSATTIVDALEAAELLTRVPDPANRRSTLLRPTPRALEVGEALRAARREAAEALFTRLDEGQRAELGELLTLLAEES